MENRNKIRINQISKVFLYTLLILLLATLVQTQVFGSTGIVTVNKEFLDETVMRESIEVVTYLERMGKDTQESFRSEETQRKLKEHFTPQLQEEILMQLGEKPRDRFYLAESYEDFVGDNIEEVLKYPEVKTDKMGNKYIDLTEENYNGEGGLTIKNPETGELEILDIAQINIEYFELYKMNRRTLVDIQAEKFKDTDLKLKLLYVNPLRENNIMRYTLYYNENNVVYRIVKE